MGRSVRIKCDICGKTTSDESEFWARITLNTCEYDPNDHTFPVSVNWDICRQCKKWFIGFMEEIKPSAGKAKSMTSFVKRLAKD